MKKWQDLLGKFGNPIDRLEKYLNRRGMLDAERTKRVRKDALEQVRSALKNSTKELLPEVDQLFEQVYEEMPQSLKDQRQELRDHLKKYPKDYSLEKFKNGEQFIN